MTTSCSNHMPDALSAALGAALPRLARALYAGQSPFATRTTSLPGPLARRLTMTGLLLCRPLQLYPSPTTPSSPTKATAKSSPTYVPSFHALAEVPAPPAGDRLGPR